MRLHCKKWQVTWLTIRCTITYHQISWLPFKMRYYTFCSWNLERKKVFTYKCPKQVVLLQSLQWCSVDCVIHHERDVREEQKYMYVARKSNNRVIPMEWSWWVTSNDACEPGEQLIVLANGDDKSDLVGWSLLLLAATVRSFAHMPLGISDRNSIYNAPSHSLVTSVYSV